MANANDRGESSGAAHQHSSIWSHQQMFELSERQTRSETELRHLIEGMGKLSTASTRQLESISELRVHVEAAVKEREELKKFKTDIEAHMDKRFSQMDETLKKHLEKIDQLEADRYGRKGVSEFFAYIGKIWHILSAFVVLMAWLVWERFGKGGSP